MSNKVKVHQSRKHGKVGYALSRIFLPYEILKYHYPVLQKQRWLTPLFEVVRWFKLVFCGGMKRSVNELKFNAQLSDESAGIVNETFKAIGL